ncbi:MAG: hypothetical protein R2751_18400 [Bacteroidales bacterium]
MTGRSSKWKSNEAFRREKDKSRVEAIGKELSILEEERNRQLMALGRARIIVAQIQSNRNWKTCGSGPRRRNGTGTWAGGRNSLRPAAPGGSPPEGWGGPPPC